MKNKKIMLLTVFAVAAALMGTLVMSEFFENSWQQPEQAENSLAADTEISDEQSVFQYPYINYTRMDDEDKAPYYDTFNYISDTFTEPENSDFTYQDAVNLTGEAVKYLTGYTEHQKSETVIQLTNHGAVLPHRNVNFYTCRFVKEHGDKTVVFGSQTDAATKEIWHIYYYELPPGESTVSNARQTDIEYTDRQEKKAVETAVQFAEEVAPYLKLTGYEVQTGKSNTGDMIWNVLFMTEDGQPVSLMFTEEYQFYAFSRFSYRISADYKEMPQE